MKKKSTALARKASPKKKEAAKPLKKKTLLKAGSRSASLRKPAVEQLSEAREQIKELKGLLKQKEKELRQNKNEFTTTHNAIVDNCLNALILGKPNGTILEVNKAATALFGFSAAEFRRIGRKGFIDMQAVETIKALKDREKEKRGTRILTGIKKNGERFTCEVSSVIFKDSNGEERTSTCIIDISQRKEQENAILEANLHMQMILDNTDESFFVIDRDLQIVTFNKTAQRMATHLLGKAFKKGDQILALGRQERIKELRKMYEYILDGNTYYYKYHLAGRKNEPFIFGLHFTPIRISGKVQAIMVNARDITKEENAFRHIDFNARNTSALINSTNDLIWSINPKKELIIGNNAFLKFIEIYTGKILKPGAALLKENYFSKEELSSWNRWYDRVLSGESFSVVGSFKTEQGEIWSETYFDPMMENETILGAAMYTKNITDRKKLEDQNALFVSIVNYSEDAIISKTTEGMITSWNDGAKKLFGYTAEEVIGKSFLLLVPPHLHNEEKKILENMRKGRHIEQYETLRMRKDGTYVHISLTVSPIADAQGKIIGASKIARDISERKMAEEQIRKNFKEISDYKFALDESSIVAITDAKGTITYANENFCKISKFSREELIGQNHRIINSGFHTEAFFVELWKTISSGKVWRGEIRNKAKNGDVYWGDTTIVPFLDKNGRPYQYIAIRSDITERKAAEGQLKKLNIELSNSNTELEQFAYVASHDLQEPLRMVSSFLQLLQKKSESELDETSNKYIHYAVDGAERMKRLILDLLQYSRAGTSSLEVVPVDMNEVVNDVLVLYKGSDAEFNIGPLPVIQGGKTAMSQLMQNLIGNAIKYKGSRKTVVNVSAEETANEWKFTVEDNGIGIDPKFYEKIFVVFQRLHTRDQYGGTGVGLAICKKIVERYKGRIWVESEPGQGSRFIFTVSKKLN